MNKQQISEKMMTHEEWYKEAKEMSLDKLPEFLRKLTEDYGHDYGTICHAMTAGAIATMWAINKSPTGGITGFQAGYIMWQFIRQWNYSSNKTGLKLIDYDNFLYPQYEDKFEKTISKETWNAIQKQAKENLDESNTEHEKYLKDLEQYKIDLINFIKKCPDYYQRRDYYDRLGCGTGQQWENYYSKVESGFEFAPEKPYDGCYGNPVYGHWQSIIEGNVPFGYQIVND